jgi:hypothetical protein
MHHFFLRLKPPTLAYILAALAVGQHFLTRKLYAFSLPYPLVVGLILAALGFAVMTWAWFLFEKRRFSRNPMYLGIVLMLLGLAYFLTTPTALLAPILFILIMDQVFIPVEETTLVETFPSEFRAYSGRVRRWL